MESEENWSRNNFKIAAIVKTKDTIDQPKDSLIHTAPCCNQELQQINALLKYNYHAHAMTAQEIQQLFLDDKSLSLFVDDNKMFYFMLKPSTVPFSEELHPYVKYEDEETQDVLPSYSHNNCFNTATWFNYEKSWKSSKHVLNTFFRNYNFVVVKSEVETEDQLNIKIYNLSDGNVQKPLASENLVIIAAQNFSLNGQEYSFPRPRASIYNNLDHIDLTSNNFVNIITIEKR